MELVEIVRVLDSILLNNITNIILKYYQICGDDYDIPSGRENVNGFCEKYLNNHERGYFVTNDVFDALDEMYDSACGSTIIYERMSCDKHDCRHNLNGENIILKYMLFRPRLDKISYITHAFTDYIRQYLEDELYDAYLRDIGVKK